MHSENESREEDVEWNSSDLWTFFSRLNDFAEELIIKHEEI